MAMSTVVNIDDSKYDSDELDRPTTAPPYNSTAVIKYMSTRTLGLNLSNSFQGSLRNFELSNSRPNFLPSPVTTSHGLASLVESSPLSRISSFDSIDGELMIDEHRDLSKLNETLTENILHCCNLDAHNRAQELQLEWLEKNANKNCLTIEKMFRTEIQTGRQLIEDTLRYKSDLEKKLNDIHQATLANDEHYQQLLSKRNAINKELFEYQRQLAQNRAESEFLRSRIQLFNEEIQFYKLKNNSLQARKVKLNYELDEEIFAKQILQMECQVLENEKITNEDMHLSTIDDIRGAIDLNQITTIQPSNYYREQLNHQLRSIRLEYNKKIQIYRDELHRNFELESYRYKIYKLRPIPTVTKEHEQKLEEYKHEKQEIEQKTSSIRASYNELINQIEILERQIDQTQITTESISNSQRHLAMFEQIIREKEEQLDEAIRIRTTFKQQIENYREEVDQFPKRIIQTEQPLISTPRKSILRSAGSQEGTLVRFIDFDVQRGLN
jgi:chromosome segregation ATPase